MKKSLCILLLLLIATFCFTGSEILAQGGETSGNQPTESAISTMALPVVPSGKSFIQNPTTYTNPISLTEGSERVLRGGEPVVTIFDDDYYLFVSMRRGYWWSHDFVDWTYVDAPNIVGGIIGVVEIDGKLYSYAGNSNNQVRATDDPKTGIWYDVGTFSSNNYGDASMLYDEETGRLYMYYGWSQLLGIRVVELDKTTFKEIGEPVVCIWGDPHNHGWETRYASDLIFPYFSHREYRPEEYGWTEGGHPLKYNGKYYLMYASIGLEFYSYGHGVYVADDPMGPYVYDEHNPLTMKTTGVAPGAGHGSIFLDKQGNVWTICMVGYALDGGRGNTLMNLFPTGVDAEGVMHGKVEYGDYPQYLPGVKADPINDNYTGWTLLTLDKRVETSSTLENYWPAFAVDEDPKSYWCAQTGDPGEYITVDIGEVSDIRGIQILWDRAGATGTQALDRYQSYTVEVSNDNQNWTLVIDKSNNPQDLRTDYIELPTGVSGRYVKLTNMFTPDNGRFAVKALRAFGNPEEATFTKVDNVMAVRSKLDRRYAHLLWEQVDGAEGYVVRYGIEPNKLYNSYMVYWDNYLDIPSLNVDPEYYFEVEAFSSGTPRYVENTFETRGRGAELDLVRQPTGGDRSTDRIMTYETYGIDEVYVFNGITPGTYTLSHTFGVGIWGPVQLTEDQLIGTGTEPTVTALNLTQFGIGSTQWGTVEVRVYPGKTSGRIEVTLKYDEYTPADKSKLEDLYKQCEALNADDYTAESWAKLQTALSSAERVLADNAATQAKVDSARKALQTAVDELEPAIVVPDKHSKYIKGYDNNTFRPDGDMTRAEVATIIARTCLTGFDETKDYGTVKYKDMVNMPESHWAKNVIKFCTDNKIFEGYEDGTFRPDNPISREEYTVLFARLKGELQSGTIPFADANKVSDWAKDGVYTAIQNGWIDGFPEDNTFRPTISISRSQAIKILNGYLNRGVDDEGLSALPAGTLTMWPDVAASHWAYNQIIEAAYDHDYVYRNSSTPPENWSSASK